MSLSLLQSYSSAEEEEEGKTVELFSDDSSSDERDTNNVPSRAPSSYNPIVATNGGSELPSAFEAFSEVDGPPKFLNNCIEEQNPAMREIPHRSRKKSRDKRDLPPGAVVESKAQLVGIHERVRSDIQSSTPSSAVSTATNPVVEDSSKQLRMCAKCGVPKAYTSARGVICPICEDRPPSEEDLKKKGSTIKDKEKSKRMRGQSSHATWKSESEMHLRQQFD